MKQIRLSLDPPETDPTLEGWKRERILIQAMMSGEVMPSNSWRPQGFKARIAELNRCISEAEDYQRARREEDEERREVEMLTHEQRITEFFLRLLYKFTPDDAVRQDIEEKTRKRAEDWEQWKQAEWQKGDNGKCAPKSFKQLADGIQKTLDGYAEMCNTYAKMPTRTKTVEEGLNSLKQMMSHISGGVSFLVQNAPNTTRPQTIPIVNALLIMKRICGEKNTPNERTIRRWLERGCAPKGNHLAISLDDLRTSASWDAWCKSYLAAVNERLKAHDYLASKRL